MDEQKNSCQGCSACCTVLGVSELDKKANVRCVHQCGSGCNRYADRPPSCAAFECLWLRGLFGNEEIMRPDNLGLMFTLMEGTKFVATGQELLCCYEVWPGASRTPEAEMILGPLASSQLILILSINGRSFIGPPEECARVRKIIQEVKSQLGRQSLPLITKST